MTVEDRLLALLHDVDHTVLDHAPVQSAEHAASLRDTPLAIGGKALVLKLGTDFALLALPGDGKLSGRAVRHGLGQARYRFATRDELLALTGLNPGAVPPFGRPVFELPLFVDAALAARAQIAFTLGRPDRSAILAMTDYLERARPERILPLSEAL